MALLGSFSLLLTMLYIARILYKYDATRLEAAQITRQILSEVTQQFKLSFDQLISIIQFLYEDGFAINIFSFKSRFPKKEERKLAKQITEQILQKQELTIDQQLQLVAIPITTFNTAYADKAYAIQMILSILQGEAARQYLEEHWQMEDNSYYYDQGEVETSDVPFIIELLKQELLPSKVRDCLYRTLRRIFPLYWDTSSIMYEMMIPDVDRP